MVDALPGTEAGGQRLPGAARALHPEHPRHDPAVIDVGPPTWSPQWGQEWAHPLPGSLGQLSAVQRRGRRVGRREHDRGQGATRSSRQVAAPGGGLLAPSPAGPPQAKGEPLRWLRQGQEQAAHLRHRQRDQVAGRTMVPFFPPSRFWTAVAWARVTSR
jgi:hypothetical protein